MRSVSRQRNGWRPEHRCGDPPDPVQPELPTTHDRVIPYGLSDGELRVLELLSEGLQDKQIALLLDVTVHTVNKHIGAILMKMNVRSRTAAAVRALREHIFAMALW